MSSNQTISAHAAEGIKIERERKYLIPNGNIADLLAQNFPKKITIPLNHPSIDSEMKNLLKELLYDPNTNSINTFIETYEFENGFNFLKTFRPNFYFDTKDNDLYQHNLTFNLRQRETDWAITIKIRPKSFVKREIQKGLFERIEVNIVITNEEIERVKIGDKININQLIQIVPSLKETFDKQIEKHIGQKQLYPINTFDIESTRTLYPLNNEGHVQLSVDNIKPHGQLKNLFELEIELKFGSQSGWLSTVFTRIFDYLCLVITKEIKESLKTKLDQSILENLLTEITHLSKFEKVKMISSPQLFYESIESEKINFTQLINKTIDFLNSDLVKEMRPLMILPYLISVTQAYPDLKPNTMSEEEYEKRRIKKVIQNRIEKYRINLWTQANTALNKTLNSVSLKTELLIPNSCFAKILWLKLTAQDYFAFILLPYEEFEHNKFFNLGNLILDNLFKLSVKESEEKEIFVKVEVNACVILNELTLSETSRIWVDNLKLYSIQDETNLLEFKTLLERRLQESQKDLDHLIKNRRLVRNNGDRGPVVSLSANKQNKKSLTYVRIDSKTLPISVKTFSDSEF